MTIRRFIQLLPLFGFIALLLLVFYGYHRGIFSSVQNLQMFIQQFGDKAVFIFILVQLTQPIVPLLPGGISTVVGMIMFGNLPGLFYSYIGGVIGEVLLFMLVRKYGNSFAQLILSDRNYQKFENQLSLHEKGIKKLLIVSFLVPFLPDDIICLVAGISPMKFKTYFTIIALLKPWSLATYGYLVIFIFHQVHL
ncbi:TVP38/TMEM64 family protein [Enterococcus nangangensis]